MIKLNNKIEAKGQELIDRERIIPFNNKKWNGSITEKPGIYVLWRKTGKKGPVYIGESCNLKERLKDLGSWRNHTFTRQIKDKYGLDAPVEIREKISKLFHISYLPLTFGRKEVEEYLMVMWGTDKLFNKPSPRYIRSQNNT